jgi:hypothetical protein
MNSVRNRQVGELLQHSPGENEEIYGRHLAVRGERVQFRNEWGHNLLSSPDPVRVNESRRMRWAGLITCRGTMRNGFKHLAAKRRGTRILWKYTCRSEDNIKMHHTEIGSTKGLL